MLPTFLQIFFFPHQAQQSCTIPFIGTSSDWFLENCKTKDVSVAPKCFDFICFLLTLDEILLAIFVLVEEADSQTFLKLFHVCNKFYSISKLPVLWVKLCDQCGYHLMPNCERKLNTLILVDVVSPKEIYLTRKFYRFARISTHQKELISMVSLQNKNIPSIPEKLEILVGGERHVGKSSLISRIQGNVFVATEKNLWPHFAPNVLKLSVVFGKSHGGIESQYTTSLVVDPLV